MSTLKVVHINKGKKAKVSTEEFANILIEKWTREGKARAEKKYGKKKTS